MRRRDENQEFNIIDLDLTDTIPTEELQARNTNDEYEGYDEAGDAYGDEYTDEYADEYVDEYADGYEEEYADEYTDENMSAVSDDNNVYNEPEAGLDGRTGVIEFNEEDLGKEVFSGEVSMDTVDLLDVMNTTGSMEFIELDDTDGYEDQNSYEESDEYYEEADEYYEEGDEYYEDEAYEYDEEQYMDEADGDYEYEEYEEEPEEDSVTSRNRGRRRKGFFANLIDKIKNFSTEEWTLVGGAVLIVVVAIIVIGVSAGNKKEANLAEGYHKIGNELANIGIPGEQGLLAMADASKAVIIYEEEVVEEEKPATYEIKVSFTSVEKDIKIKFTDTGTSKLITGIEFEVVLVDKNGNKTSLKDEDKDGIIYKNNMTSGDYTIEITEVEGYSFSGYDSKINIKDKISYQQIDVADEIKKESEINVAAEDTAINNIVEEEAPTVTDTVEWVESTKTAVDGTDNGYKGIDKSTIPEPSYSWLNKIDVKNEVTAYKPAAYKINVLWEPSENEEQEPTEEPTEKPTEKPTEEPTAAPTEAPTAAPTAKPTASPTATPTAKPTATPTASPTATPTASPAATASASPSASASVSPSASPESLPIKDLKLNNKTVTVAVGKTASLVATATMSDDSKITDAQKFTWKSSDEKIAKVSAGTITAVSKGTATITVTYTDVAKTTKTVTCTVTVVDNPENDKTTKLKDKNGNQVYIKDSKGKYVEATYADYYTAKEFFILTDAQYRYTGWQTINGNVYYYDKNGNKVTGDQVIQGVKYKFTAEGILSVDANGKIGIDVSKWNGNIDWNAVKNSGVSFVIIRCGYRGSSSGVLVEDPKFRSNIQGASAAGLKVGIYFFTQAVNEVEAVEEASMTISLIRGYGIGYPVFIDTERSGGRADSLDKATRTAVCKAYCETIKSAGYTPGVYASKSWYNNNLNYSALSGYRIWLAQYASAPTFSNRYDIWQHTEKGTVNGISGKVDMNISYMGY